MTPKHYKAALLMALGMSQVWIADKLSMTTAGVRKWTTDPEFQALVAEVTDAVISDTTAIMSDARRRAFAAATEIFESDSAKPSDRLDAIKLVLDRTGDAPRPARARPRTSRRSSRRWPADGWVSLRPL